MSQDGVGVDLETSLGYLLKEASSALRAAMEEVLRPLGMSVTHYSCLELLGQRPGLSNSDLARGAFVTRQSMNVLLQALEREGYVTRPAEASVGKVLPTRLTPSGRRSLDKATAAVRSVEVRMLAGMTEPEQSGAFRILQSMIQSLREGSDGAQVVPRRTARRPGTEVQQSARIPTGSLEIRHTPTTPASVKSRSAALMPVAKLHDDEVDIDEVVVRRLLREQLPQWAELPLRLVEPSGTDNMMIRLGDDLVTRLPRIESAAAWVEKEQRLVPRVAAELPPAVRNRVAVPIPVGLGEPGAGYPWHWSVYPWLAGRNPGPEDTTAELAADLAEFARALRGVDTFGLRAEGALHSYRADSIQLRDELTRRFIGQCADLLDADDVASAWQQLREVPDFDGEPVWMHSDLQPGNLLIDDGRLSAVIDWGGLALGDPAVDCMVAWNLLTPGTRPVFREYVDVDDATWARARAWAFSVALVALPYYRGTNEQITSYSRHAIEQVLVDIRGH